MENNTNNGYEFNFKKITDVFSQFLVWIILTVILFGALAAIFTEVFIEDTYSTSVSFYVKDSENSSTTTTQQYSAADIHVYTSMAILSAGECRETLGIKGKGVTITSSKKNNTPMFVVKVSGTDRYTACEVAAIIRDELPEYVFATTQTGSLSVYDFTGVDTVADGPNVFQNVVIAALIGFVCSFIFFFLRIVLDTEIHSEEDIRSRYPYPILGAIPSMIEEAQSGGGYYSYSRK